MMMRFARSALRGLAPAALLLPLLVLGRPALALPTTDDLGLNSLAGSYLAARTADAGKDFQSAASFYRSALAADPSNLFLLERAVVLTAAAGDVQEAIELARKLVAEAPTSHAALLIVAVDQIRAGRPAEAAKTLDTASAGVLADLTEGLITAWALFGEGEIDKALDGLAKLKGEPWYEPFKRLHSGHISLAAGRTEEALKFFGEAREADANAVRITEAYARALAVAGRKADAEAALEEFLTRFPDNALARAALGEVKAGRGHLATVATPAAGTAEALAGIGAAVGQEGGLEVASFYLRLALYLDPQTAGGLGALSLGNLLDASDQGEAAIAVFKSVGPDAPFRALGFLRAALALDRMDRTEEAEQAFKQALADDPEDLQAYIAYGNMLRGRERFAEAEGIYSQALARIPQPGRGDWTLLYFRGIAYERTKQWDKAEADFKRALQLYPDQPLVLNYLGYTWVDMGRNLQEALAMIRKAVELRPNDGFIVDSLGWAYYRLGRYADAVTELERAIALKPEDPTINDHLGDAYWRLGRELEAQFQWRHARDFGAEGTELELILKKIAEEKLIEAQKDAAFYTVAPGDTLWTISARLLKSGNAFERLIDANKDILKRPYRLTPGMQLRIPDAI
jgi:tetratricopeptide (TPR) repeat protein